MQIQIKQIIALERCPALQTNVYKYLTSLSVIPHLK